MTEFEISLFIIWTVIVLICVIIINCSILGPIYIIYIYYKKERVIVRRGIRIRLRDYDIDNEVPEPNAGGHRLLQETDINVLNELMIRSSRLRRGFDLLLREIEKFQEIKMCTMDHV